ncbi:hypothetical protein CR513_24717, partial [Mucuna pruriens]
MLEDIRWGIKDPCKDWVALKRMMRDRFIPPSYTWDLHNKHQRIYQGSRSVEEYHKEMEMDLMRAQIREREAATMARFLHGLNKEMQDVVELQHYGTLGGCKLGGEVHLRRLMRGLMDEKGKEKVRREKSLKKGCEPSQGRKEVVITLTPNAPRTSSIKCFKRLGKGYIASQCPNQRAMILKP